MTTDHDESLQNYNLEGSNDSKSPNPINTYDDLLALLNERDIGCGKNCQSAYGALRAVVEREEEKAPPIIEGQGRWDWLYQDGYNRCLAEIKADIEKELG